MMKKRQKLCGRLIVLSAALMASPRFLSSSFSIIVSSASFFNFQPSILMFQFFNLPAHCLASSMSFSRGAVTCMNFRLSGSRLKACSDTS